MQTTDLKLSQNTEEFRSIRYGLFPMSFNGCEIIAVYNALTLLGKKTTIEELVKIFAKKHLRILFGLFGSNVYRTHRALEAFGIGYKEIKLNATGEDGVYIISFWNIHPPFNGIHTVTTLVEGKKTTTFNLYSNVPVSEKAPMEFAGKRFIKGYKLER